MTIGRTISLPFSKSMANRRLVADALAGRQTPENIINACHDTRVLGQALLFDSDRLDCTDSGTALRFLTAVCAVKRGSWLIDGSARLRQRPIAPLVDALRLMGADICYEAREGFAPLRIVGRELSISRVEIDASESSQFASALMLVAPYLPNGLEINLVGTESSLPYLRLTADMMRLMGVAVAFEGRTVRIEKGVYADYPTTIERDWSAASYWYAMMTIPGSKPLVLEDLTLESLQGDAEVARLFELFGVESEQLSGGVRLTQQCRLLQSFEHDFSANPDLVPTFAVLCCARHVPFSFSGVGNLELKESPRATHLVEELRKCGFRLQFDGAVLRWGGTTRSFATMPAIDTHNDHRLAMAFAAMAMERPMIIRNPEVVEKSYPDFWEQYERLKQY